MVRRVVGSRSLSADFVVLFVQLEVAFLSSRYQNGVLWALLFYCKEREGDGTRTDVKM